MKKYFLLLILTIISCNHSKEKRTPKKELEKFFESDKIDHYYLDISEDKIINILCIKNKTKDEKELGGLLASHYPDSISEPDFELKLKKFHFIKKELSEKKKKEVETVFSQKDSLQNEYSSCLPNYRDIFIFKRKNSIIGIAKVCFGCGVTQFLGTKVDTDGFGLPTELDKLEKIIRE
ncbi:hypothetical protein LNQ49_08240 [Flavobacterium sp. F-65]|jgi:hypothetical protein|uniref:Lipoprotein n=1 Tax=Flavobacterium pisciphilum TaxID=2893755 RepID=A0ABS8MS19_9FLAO|nr:hypothetical protein [Flavobacterium sp. F-65]MCC9071566.1 hypothetical protein [Flavobacterium sp. F-65]